MRSSKFIQRAGVVGGCAALAGLVRLLGGAPFTIAPPRSTSAEQTILDVARHKPEDPALGVLFDELNARHFGGTLPDAKVMWEGDLDRLDVGEYRLNGMTDGTVVLLKSALKEDAADVRRTLCHEMVHVKFIAAGDGVTTHDVPFQDELRRVFEGGCFDALLASPEEKASLKTWIETERQRLDAGRRQVSDQGAAVKREADRVDQVFAELNERIKTANAAGSGWPDRGDTETAERQRTASNAGIEAYNAAVVAIERDQTQFNDVVRRYNLMLAYPDGLAEDRARHIPVVGRE